jgi:hypothetical protein
MTAPAYRAHFSAFDYSADGVVTMTKPSGTAAADILLFGAVNNDGNRTLSTLPSGFSALHSSTTETAPSTGAWSAVKTAGASEPATYDFGFNDSFNGATALLAYSGSSGVDVSAAATISGVLSASPYSFTAPSITTTVSDCLDVIIVGLRFTTVGATPVWPTISGWTKRVEVIANYDPRALAIYERTAASPGATGTVADSVSVSGGGSARVTVHRVALAPSVTSTTARPDSDVSAGTWTASSGSDLYAMLDEETPSDADYIEASSAGTCEVALSTIAEPQVGWQTTVRFRIQGECTVSLREGSTQIASWNYSPVSATTYEETLTSGEQSSVTDWGDLRLRFVKA